MEFLGQGYTCSVLPFLEHMEKAKLTRQRQCVYDGLCVGMTS